MIRLISKRTKEPKKEAVVTYRKKCPYCGAIFEYNYSDTKGWSDAFPSTIECPDCKLESNHHFWYKVKEKRNK